MSNASSRNPYYCLGTVINGAVYIYTALGTFRTAGAAATRSQEKRATVFVSYELTRNGVNYGSTAYEAVAQTA